MAGADEGEAGAGPDLAIADPAEASPTIAEPAIAEPAVAGPVRIGPVGARPVGARPVGTRQVGTRQAGTDGAAAAPENSTDRLSLYRYLAAPDRLAYIPIMRLFASTLLADLSASEVAVALAAEAKAGSIDPDQAQLSAVVPRLTQLVRWGNLVAGRRETVAASIAEFQHGGVRYQISKLGVRVQRDAEELLAVPAGAREVSREMLPAIERGLSALGGALATAMTTARRDPESAATRAAMDTLAERVVTLFLQHAELAATVRDFYAYLGQVLTRFDLAPDEIAGFRDLLVEYIQRVVDDVLRYTPTIATRLQELAGVRDELLSMLRTGDPPGGAVERSRGRSAADWEALTGWFVDAPGRPSQVTALRQATARAVGGLLAAVKRTSAGAGPRPSRRAALLRLAGWFDESPAGQANALYAAAFGLYPARHFGPAPELDADDDHTRWRDGPLVDVPVSVRRRGERAAAGRGSRIVVDPLGDELLRQRARDRADRRSDAVSELAAAAGRLDEATLSRPALDVLCELLGAAMSARDNVSEVGVGTDPVHQVRLTIAPGEGPMRVTSVAGTLTIADARLSVEAAG